MLYPQLVEQDKEAAAMAAQADPLLDLLNNRIAALRVSNRATGGAARTTPPRATHP